MTKKKSIISDFVKCMRPYGFFFILCLFLQLGITFLGIFQLHLLRRAIDLYVLNENFFGLVNDVVLIYLLALCLLMIFNFLQNYFTAYIGQNMMLDLRMKIFSHLQRMALPFFNKNPIGRLMAVATNDVQLLQPLLTEMIPSIFGNILLFLGISAYLFYQNHQLTLIIYTYILTFGFSLSLLNRRIRKVTMEQRSWFEKISSFLQENITGVSLIKIFHRQKAQSVKLKFLNKSYEDASTLSLSYINLASPVTAIFKAAVISSILWHGGREVLRGSLSFGALLVFVGSMVLLFGAIEKVVQTNRILQTARASLERIFGFLDATAELERPQGKIKLPEFKNKIEFKNVWFAYENDNFVIEDFNLEIQKGEQIGIVGYSGSGKTSITNLLARFYEIDKGKISIDGVDIRNIEKKQLRLLIGIVPQHPFLFSGNIEDNIRLGNSEIDSQQVQRAAAYVGADKFINQLPNRYTENVQELGSRLSTGQKQLISFARAAAFNPQIIILDEATANVDPETTIKFKDTLKRIKGERTTIVIAHHLTTVHDADKIVVLHLGKIKETGTHQELMEKKGLYYKLHLLQEIEDRLTEITRLVTRLTEIVGYARLHYVKNAQLARRIGEKLNLSKEKLDKLETAALIYDVGKIRIPFDILTKPASLTDKEFEIIKSHVTYSKRLAERVENFEDIAMIVCYHHEHWDGKGYLQGLKGEKIPLESRIIAIVDAFHAMVSKRPYREALTLEEARKELLAGAGKQFDPHIVDVFIRILQDGVW